MTFSERKKYFFDVSCGEALIAFREERGYETQGAFAKEKMIDPKQYSRYESGKNINKDTLYILLEHLDISFEKYYARVENLANEKINNYQPLITTNNIINN